MSWFLNALKLLTRFPALQTTPNITIHLLFTWFNTLTLKNLIYLKCFVLSLVEGCGSLNENKKQSAVQRQNLIKRRLVSQSFFFSILGFQFDLVRSYGYVYVMLCYVTFCCDVMLLCYVKSYVKLCFVLMLCRIALPLLRCFCVVFLC